MAVLVQGRPADAEIQAVVDELNDPLWDKIDSVEAFGRDELLAMVRAEIETFTASRPAFDSAVKPLNEVITSEQ